MGVNRSLRFKSTFSEKCKKILRYSFLITMPLVSSCATNARAAPRHTTFPDYERRLTIKMDLPPSATCRIRGRDLEYTQTNGRTKLFKDMLRSGEKALGVKCNDQYASVLTKTRLLTVPGSNSAKDLVNREVEGDMKPFHKKGIVDWALGYDRHFILTRDSELREDLIINHGNTDMVHSLPYDVRGAKMEYHKGFLFIALASSQMLVLKFSKSGLDNKKHMFSVNVSNPDFFFVGRRLYFGQGSDSVEIKIKGKKLSDVLVK
jgi:hypothetical protein